MVKRMHQHQDAVEKTAYRVWEEIVNKYAKTEVGWEHLTLKRKKKLLKKIKFILRDAEKVARTRAPK